jgi:hypothetical protein
MPSKSTKKYWKNKSSSGKKKSNQNLWENITIDGYGSTQKWVSFMEISNGIMDSSANKFSSCC